MMGRGRARKQILQRNISEIIEERLKDITRFVLRELRGAKCMTKLPYGVVLTGGSAYLADIEQLFSRELGVEVRLGKQIYGITDDSCEKITAFAKAAVIGVLQYGSTRMACNTTEKPSTPTTKVENESGQTDVEVNDIFHQGNGDVVGGGDPVEQTPQESSVEPKPEVSEVDSTEDVAEEVVEVDSEEVDDNDGDDTSADEDDKSDAEEKQESGNNGNNKKGRGLKGLIGSLVDAFNSALGYSEEL